jgi:hypothetical protein
LTIAINNNSGWKDNVNIRGVIFGFVVLIFIIGCSASEKFSVVEFESNIIRAKRWGSVPATDSLARKHKITHITLHHQGEPFPEGKDPEQYLRNLQSWSRREKKWIDIPYHYIIDLHGKIYEGRDIKYAGDTNTEYDPTGHALIEVVGNFEEVEPNQKQLDAVIETMAWLVLKYNVSIDSIRAHRDYSTQTVCPGKNLYYYVVNGYFKRKVKEHLSSVR